jgi:hypothetical protein
MVDVLVAVRDLWNARAIVHRRWCLLRLPAGNTAYPLAALANRALLAKLAGESVLLPYATGPDHDRQPRSAHRGRSQSFRQSKPRFVARSLQRHRDPSLLPLDPVDPVGGSDDPAGWGCRDRYPGVYGLRGTDLCSWRDDGDAIDWHATNPATFRPAALRGRFSV